MSKFTDEVEYYRLAYRESIFFLGEELLFLMIHRNQGFDDDTIFHLRNCISSVKCYFSGSDLTKVRKEIEYALNPEAKRASFGNLRRSKTGIELYGGDFSTTFKNYRLLLPELLSSHTFRVNKGLNRKIDSLLSDFRQGTNSVSKQKVKDNKYINVTEYTWLFNLLKTLSNAYYIQSCRFDGEWSFYRFEIIEMWNQLNKMLNPKAPFKYNLGRHLSQMSNEKAKEADYAYEVLHYGRMEDVINSLELIVSMWLSSDFQPESPRTKTLIYCAMDSIENNCSL